jgi:hypothetical protein
MYTLETHTASMYVGVYSDESPRMGAAVPLAALQPFRSVMASWPLLEDSPSLATLQRLLHRLGSFPSSKIILRFQGTVSREFCVRKKVCYSRGCDFHWYSSRRDTKADSKK